MPSFIGVSFRRSGRIYFFNPGELNVSPGDIVVVQTVRGLELGKVMSETKSVPEEEAPSPVRRIIRKATTEDRDRVHANRLKAIEAFMIGAEKIKTHNLPMKLVDVEYTLDENKIVFYFTAEGRVDFRSLVRDLASVFRKRIELHQIGVRDEAKILGGLGLCGRPCCCATFVTEFDPVSIRMAKEQNLSLNPERISGTCGRLMCCLKYEYDLYRELGRELPPLDTEVTLPEGTGVVVELNVPKRTALVELASKARVELPASKLKWEKAFATQEIEGKDGT